MSVDAGVEWLDSTQLDQWLGVVALVSTLPAALDAQLKRDAGLNLFEYHILVHLGDAPSGFVPMSDLATVSLGSPSRITHAVSRLENSGYVERITCHEAGRRTAARLTPAGKEKLERSAPGHVREVRRLLIDVLTPDQLDALGTAGRTVAEVIAPEMMAAIGNPSTIPDPRG